VSDAFDSQEFHELMMDYRSAIKHPSPQACYEQVQAFIRAQQSAKLSKALELLKDANVYCWRIDSPASQAISSAIDAFLKENGHD
jgi:hypothetical protein